MREINVGSHLRSLHTFMSSFSMYISISKMDEETQRCKLEKKKDDRPRFHIISNFVIKILYFIEFEAKPKVISLSTVSIIVHKFQETGNSPSSGRSKRVLEID